MTKKDYIAIAALLKRAKHPREIADGLCAIFAADNPRFDRARFLAACGLAKE